MNEPIPKAILVEIINLSSCHSREIDDILWESMEPSLPSQKPYKGGPRENTRKLINGILYVVMTGCMWKDIH
ncbi:transposase [Methanosarcina barkeri]|uniref:transposase n=1 Tax=Methanosarcina barkeri TaxID=2208 RepID=UPI000A75969E|nr:transposase [Methanosarcina barkeri]